MTILIVDDSQAIRQVLAEILEDEGYATHTVDDGQAALSYLELHQNAVHLIVLDLTMPQLSGWGFLQVRRARHDLLEIPVLVLSAYPGTAALAIGGGVVAYLPKPWDPAQLREQVRQLSALRGLGAE